MGEILAKCCLFRFSHRHSNAKLSFFPLTDSPVLFLKSKHTLKCHLPLLTIKFINHVKSDSQGYHVGSARYVFIRLMKVYKGLLYGRSGAREFAKSLMFMTHFLRGYEMGCTDEELWAPGPDSQPRAPETA